MPQTRLVNFGAGSFRVCDDEPHYYRNENDEQCGPFWTEFNNGRWEPDTLHAIAALSQSDASILYDIGAWIGPITLYAASLGLDVVAVEPDPSAFMALLKNVDSAGLAERITLINAAVHAASNEMAFVRLYSDSLGDSETSISPHRLRNGTDKKILNSYLAAGVELEAVLEQRGDGARHAIVKLDIEGAEFWIASDLAKALRRSPADLLLALHPENIMRSSNASEAHRARHNVTEVLRGLDMFPRYYWRTDSWHCGSYSALLGATLDHGEHIKAVIATAKNLDATLRTDGMHHAPQRH